jgi:hypothetical protein
MLMSASMKPRPEKLPQCSTFPCAETRGHRQSWLRKRSSVSGRPDNHVDYQKTFEIVSPNF